MKENARFLFYDVSSFNYHMKTLSKGDGYADQGDPGGLVPFNEWRIVGLYIKERTLLYSAEFWVSYSDFICVLIVGVLAVQRPAPHPDDWIQHQHRNPHTHNTKAIVDINILYTGRHTNYKRQNKLNFKGRVQEGKSWNFLR